MALRSKEDSGSIVHILNAISRSHSHGDEDQGTKDVHDGLFPGSSVVKSLPTDARDTGSIPDLGRSHVPQSNQAYASHLSGLCSRAGGP